MRETRHLTLLREKHQLVLKEAATLGLSTEGSKSSITTKTRQRGREDGGLKVKDLTDRIVALAREFKEAKTNGAAPDVATQKRKGEAREAIFSLNGAELKILIGNLRGRTDMDDGTRREMIYSSFAALAEKKPESALALLMEAPDLLGENQGRKPVLSSVLSQWAKNQPLEALKWMQENAENHPELATDETKEALIGGAAKNNITLALQLIGELKLSPNSAERAIPEIVHEAATPEQQIEFLTAIRKQAGTTVDKEAGENLLSSGLRSLFSKVFASGYDGATAWISTANLSTDESGKLVDSLDYSQTKGDTGKWLDGMSKQGLTPKQTDLATQKLMSGWTRKDYKAAGEWLAQATAGPLKEKATVSYIGVIASYDPDVAAQWAHTLPAEQQNQSLKTIYNTIKSKDQAAAAAFATQHGIDVTK